MKKMVCRILLVLNESTLSMIPLLFALKKIFMRNIRCNEYTVMTHTGGGSSIALRAGKGRYMFIRGMIKGGLVGWGMEYPPKKVDRGTTPWKT